MTEFEKTGGTYRKEGLYLLPNLTLQEDGQAADIGVWGIRHRRYLKQHHRVLYYNLLTAGNYYKQCDIYKPAKGGMINIFRLFICKSYDVLRKDGHLSLIFPMAFMCDLSSAKLREFVLKENKIDYLEAFPERDNENKRVFKSAKMSVCILGSTKTHVKEDVLFPMRISDDRRVVESRQNDANWICAVPYGYYFVDTKNMVFEVDEQAAVVVREIFSLYNKGWGYKKIANYLTEKNIPTPRMLEKERKEAEAIKSKGKIEVKIKASPVWAVPSISGILQNDFYIGTLRQHKYTRRNINGTDKKLDEEEHKVFENHHTAIVDVKEYMKAQQNLKARTKSNYRGVKKYDNVYSGLLFCGDCQSPMFSMSRSDLAPAYTCGTYHKRGLKGCTSHHTRVDVLDTMLKKYIERVMKNSEKMIAELEKAIKTEPQTMRTSASTIAQLEVELAKARESYKATQKQKIRELMKADETNRDIIEETYEEMEAELLQKIDGLEKQLEMTVERRNTTIEVNRIAKTALQIFHDILEKDKLDKDDLLLIVDKIMVYDGIDARIDIQLKPDITMLLETGTLTEEELEEAGYRGKVVNFNWDIEGNLSATIVQKVRNQKDKAFGVNVICGGDPLEIFTDREGEIILKKYSPIGEFGMPVKLYAESLSQTMGCTVCITDTDQVIAVSGAGKKDLEERFVRKEFLQVLGDREVLTACQGDDRYVKVTEEMNEYEDEVISPIISAGDIIGAVVLLNKDKKKHFGEVEQRVAVSAADFLGRQME